jgi:hypothetical protein
MPTITLGITCPSAQTSLGQARALDTSGLTATGGFSVAVLNKEHDREAFDCGRAELNAYLRTQARQEMDRGSAVVYVQRGRRIRQGSA